MTWIEVIATIFGILCVWLTIKQNILCWPAGLVQVFLYIFIFYDAKLYADMVLHVFYVFLSVYGWLWWGRPVETRLKLSRVHSISFWIAVMFVGSLVCGAALMKFTDASLPFIDSFVVMASLVAQWLMARKKLESWLFWIIADIVGIGIYGYKGLYFTAFLYLIFLFMAIGGYFTWKREFATDEQTIEDIMTA